MKVLHVIDALGLGGGAEHSLATLLPRLASRGVSSSVVTLTPRSRGLQHELARAGYPIQTLRASRLPGQVRELRKIVRETEPDLVHATLLHASLVSRLALVGSPAPLLNSLVNTRYDEVRQQAIGAARWKTWLLRQADGLTLRRRVDHVHAISEAVALEATELLGFDPERVTIIPRGREAAALGERTPERSAAVRASLGLRPDESVLLTVGRQDIQKDHTTLVRAAAELDRRGVPATVLIAGREGSATPAIHDAIRAAGPGAEIRLLGHRDDVADLLAAADLFVFPSLYEGLGCAVLEAFALETPVVATDPPAVVEVLEDGRLGVLVPRADDLALAEAIQALLAAPERRAELARLAHERFAERYEIERIADATVALYEQLAGLHRPEGHQLP